jgi:hypothetical protein
MQSLSSLRRAVMHVMEQRRHAAEPTSTCLLLPAKHALQALTKGWTTVHTIPRGAKITHVKSDRTHVLGTAKRTLKVLYCPPLPKPILEKRQSVDALDSLGPHMNEPFIDGAALGAAGSAKPAYKMLFGCKAAGVDANILFDSGATENFVSASFAETHKIAFQEASGVVLLGDNSLAAPLGNAKVHLALGAFHSSIQCTVLKSLIPGIDLIIGEAFMIRHKVVLDYEKTRCTLKKGSRRITAASKPPKRDIPPSDPTTKPKLLSALQVKRQIRKGAPVGLGLLTQVQEVDSSSKPELKPQEPWVRQLLDEYNDVF